jgi:hypothetical protein
VKAKPKRFAEGTSVSAEKSRIEIEHLLAKHGATQRSFATDDDTGRTVLTFRLSERMARISMAVDAASIPDPSKSDWNQKPATPKGWAGWAVPRRREWVAAKRDQMNRELMRRLLLVLKAKLELIQDGVTTFEREFLADILLPNGETMHEAIRTRLAEAYDTGNMPLLLPAAGGAT